MRFSIVVPCYNCINTLERTFHSLISQEYNEYEIILVDDGSTDGTERLCDRLGEPINNHCVRVIHQHNQGLISAWKRGVGEANGEYIVFCDADDYIDANLLSVLSSKIDVFPADLFLYSSITEYEDGKIVKDINPLSEGFYDKCRIEKEILPQLYTNGSMGTLKIAKSRWSKAFKRSLLDTVIPVLNNNLTNGEDEATTFACILNASGIYSLENFWPYHYMRNNASMVGRHDTKMVRKLECLYEQMFLLADKYKYLYLDQIWYDCIEVYLVYAKKEICRDKGSYKDVVNIIEMFRSSKWFEEAEKRVSLKEYDAKSRIFAWLFINRQYRLLLFFTKLASGLGVGVS